MDRRQFDIIQLNAELRALIAIKSFEDKYIKRPEEVQNATSQKPEQTNNTPAAELPYSVGG